MKSDKIKDILKLKPHLRCRLFSMGFYASTVSFDTHNYPFYGDWNTYSLSGLSFAVHKRQHFYSLENNDISIALIGHAYDPIHMISDEMDILKVLTGLEGKAFFDRICLLTGVYTLVWKAQETWQVLGDATGMQTTFYSMKNGQISISSHINLLGDMLGLDGDSYIEHLSNYRFFRMFGDSLPGDLTPFVEAKRVIPNHYIEFSSQVIVHRFHTPEIKKLPYGQIVDKAADLLHRNLQLISTKWKRPAISMTGGCDSKTTISCANGLYDKFRYFSYVSQDAEKVDADAAHLIAKKIITGMGIEHQIYSVPNDDCVFQDIEEHRQILCYNASGLITNNRNDVRKRCYFIGVDDFDVEVKSWASEIGRAYYSKRFNNRKNFPLKPTPRVCTTMYKFFLYDRALVRQTDKVFEEYLKKYSLNSTTIPWQEQFFWEFRVASWNGNVITGEHRYSFDITIPYNNCELLELLLSVPLEDRIADKLYTDIRKKMNPQVDEIGIHVQNLKHTSNRARIENMYFVINSHIPF